MRARVPMSLVLLVLAACVAGEGWELGKISLSLAISAMCSDVKTIFPLPQHACGNRPEAAPSRSHPSLQRMSAAASEGSKNSKFISVRSRSRGFYFMRNLMSKNMTSP